MARRSRKKLKLDLAWMRLQDGTLVVDLETATVCTTVRRNARLDEPSPLAVCVTNDTARGSSGYHYVKLARRIGGRLYQQSAFVHRIVKMAAINEPLDDKDEIDHLDADPTNNRLSNLEVVSGVENIIRRDVRNGIKPDETPL